MIVIVEVAVEIAARSCCALVQGMWPMQTPVVWAWQTLSSLSACTLIVGLDVIESLVHPLETSGNIVEQI